MMTQPTARLTDSEATVRMEELRLRENMMALPHPHKSSRHVRFPVMPLTTAERFAKAWKAD